MKKFKSECKTVGGNEGNKCNYPTRLDTYGCGCQHDCSYCIDGDTLILMYDGKTKKMKDICIGDEIYGVKKGEAYHYFTKAVVLDKWETEKPSYKVTLENGTELICSGDHRWLTNRGWKYTTGSTTGNERRSFITTKNRIMGFSSCIDTSMWKETEMYMRGYLSGVIRGDGELSMYDYSGKRREKDIQYHFRLAVRDVNITERTKEYLLFFGIKACDFMFPMVDRKTKETISIPAIRTSDRESYERINEIIQMMDNPEYLRGFLAGIYDAEGDTDVYIKRIHNSDDSIINHARKALELFDFSYVMDKEHKTKNKYVKTIRLTGGFSEALRFYQIMQPAAESKFNFDGIALKNSNNKTNKIKTIVKHMENQKLYDITTSTGNFIANGVVSHNCYAKSLLDFRKLWNARHPSVTTTEELRKEVRKLKRGDVVRLGGMTDCFQPLERTHRNTYNLIRMLNRKGIHYLIVTKSDLIASDEYIQILDKNLAHIQITVTTTDDELSFTYEKATAPSKRIAAIEKLQELGYDVQLRLSPFIPQYIDFDKLNSVKCDKILVEFLRVNTWIRKWFDIDYSEYTIKQSGYSHLPLKKKKEYIQLITGFKEMTVCEDVTAHHQYWENNFNHNKKDCCNLSFRKEKENE